MDENSNVVMILTGKPLHIQVLIQKDSERDEWHECVKNVLTKEENAVFESFISKIKEMAFGVHEYTTKPEPPPLPPPKEGDGKLPPIEGGDGEILIP